MKTTTFLSLLSLIATLTLTSCQDDTEVNNTLHFSTYVNVDYVVGDQPLELNQLIYTTMAGNSYSVTDMRYLLSDFVFTNTDGTDFRSEAIFYADADRPDLSKLKFYDLPNGTYNHIAFVIGLTPEMNVTDGLPNVADFSNMTWPGAMGGGYHFMRFEGHFVDSLGSQSGYAWHLGRNTSLMQFNLDHEFTISEQNRSVGTLTMDIDKYFHGPITMDLDTTVFSMMNAELMEIMATNGLDVFTIK